MVIIKLYKMEPALYFWVGVLKTPKDTNTQGQTCHLKQSKNYAIILSTVVT